MLCTQRCYVIATWSVRDYYMIRVKFDDTRQMREAQYSVRVVFTKLVDDVAYLLMRSVSLFVFFVQLEDFPRINKSDVFAMLSRRFFSWMITAWTLLGNHMLITWKKRSCIVARFNNFRHLFAQNLHSTEKNLRVILLSFKTQNNL